MILWRPAIPAAPTTMTGTGRCSSMSQTRARLQGASTNCGEKRPTTFIPNALKMKYTSTSASRKGGVDSPIKPNTVAA